MEGKFITKPNELVVEEVEQWLDFLPSDPIRIERDEMHHLVDGALNLIMVEGESQGTAATRLKDAIHNAIMSSTKICGNYDLLSGDEYILQIRDCVHNPLSIEEINAVNEFCSELRQDVDLVWGISRRATSNGIGIKIAARNLKITQPWNNGRFLER